MSRLFCCVKGERGEKAAVKEEDYLLPGGEWDPSLSASPSRSTALPPSNQATKTRVHTDSGASTRSSIRSFFSRKFGRGSGRSRASTAASTENLVAGGGEYQPPPLVPSKTLPTVEEFKLLKTVGRGAFGKVSKNDAPQQQS